MSTKTSNREQLRKLEQLAEEIGSAGKADDLSTGAFAPMAEMLKGMQSAIGELTTLLKAKPPMPPPAQGAPPSKGAPPMAPPMDGGGAPAGDDEPMGDDDGDEDEEPMDDDLPDDPDAGYQDMQMSRGAGAKANDDVYLDVEELVVSVDRELRQVRPMIKAIREHTAAVRRNNELIEGLLAFQAQTVGPMAKAIHSLGVNLSAIPAGSRIPAARPGAAEVGRFWEAPAPTGKLGELSGRTLGQVLLKAVNTRTIDEMAMIRFQQTRRFAVDDAENIAATARVEALIASAASSS